MTIEQAIAAIAASLRADGCPVATSGDVIRTPRSEARAFRQRNEEIVFVSKAEQHRMVDIESVCRYLRSAITTVKMPPSTLMLVVMAEMYGPEDRQAVAYIDGHESEKVVYAIPLGLGRAFVRGQATVGQILDALMGMGCPFASNFSSRMLGEMFFTS